MRTFISYTHDSREHMERVLALSNRLRQEGVDSRIDQYEQSPPEGWPLWCEKQVEQSSFVLVACTETYLRRFKGEEAPGKGLGATWEGHIISQELYNSQGENSKFIPIIFSEQDATYVPRILQGATIYEVLNGYETLYRRLTKQPLIQMPELGTVKPMAAREVLPSMPTLARQQDFLQPWNVPIPPNPFFTGRKKVLADVEEELHTGGQVALTGMGGVGKTQIAAHFAHEHRGEYSAVLWASAASQETLVSGFAAIASLLDLPAKDEKDQALAVAAVKRWLEANGGWLLILDNASDLATARGFIPRAAKGHVLLTTQAQATGAIQAIEVLGMLPEDGALLILRRAKVIKAGARLNAAVRRSAPRISRELGGLPLALDQAGAYIEETRCGLASYLDLYGRRRAELLKRRGGFSPPHPESVATTFALSFERVATVSPAAADLLRLCAFLHPDGIPEEIFNKGAAELGPNLGPIARDPLKLNAAFAEILRYSLLRRDADAKTLGIHRLVQEVIQDGLTKKEKRQWAERAVRAVNRTFPPVEFANWAQCERLVPQALACATLIETCGFDFEAAARLLNEAGCYLRGRARSSDAEPLYQRALTIYERAVGPEHPHMAASLNNLAGLFRAKGRYAQAEPLYQRALAIREKVLGPEHPDVATSLNNLAGLYGAQSKDAQAEPLCQRALAIQVKVLGPDHPSVATSLNNLAELYRAQGKYAQAKPLCQRALAIDEKALGPDHPNVATSLNNLALLYHNQGKYAQAEPLYQRALAIAERALGRHHPEVATVLENYAGLLRELKRGVVARELEARAQAIRAAHAKNNPSK